MLFCYMAFKIMLLREEFSANVTLEMEFKSVNLHMGFLRKFRIANGAFEGFFACVQQHVTFQIARIGEAFLAHFAMYWFIHQYLLSSIKKVF